MLGVGHDRLSYILFDDKHPTNTFTPVAILVNLWARMPVAICLSTGSWQTNVFLVSMYIDSVANYVKYSYIHFSIVTIYVFVCIFFV